MACEATTPMAPKPTASAAAINATDIAHSPKMRSLLTRRSSKGLPPLCVGGQTAWSMIRANECVKPPRPFSYRNIILVMHLTH